MKIFVDTNILLDVLEKRLPFYHDSAAIWTLAEKRKIEGFISAVSFTNIFYILRKLESRAKAMKGLRLIRQVFLLSPCDADVIDHSINLDFKDFEDAVQLSSALRADATCLITRNPNHFPKATLPILTPVEFLALEEIKPLLSNS